MVHSTKGGAMTNVLRIEHHNKFGSMTKIVERIMPCSVPNVLREKRVRLSIEETLIMGGDITLTIRQVYKAAHQKPEAECELTRTSV